MRKLNLFLFLSLIALAISCGSARDEVNEIANEQRIKGHWLMTQSEHGSTIERALENESMVLTFKDGKAAFSPTDSLRGRAVYTALSRCNQAVRPYETQRNQLVFMEAVDCP